ncbi:MAG TPA: thiamine pyrophosphate-binding protein [Gammaproteobacteria bacterium]|jgi:acetolactate synthase-1/2/3 large subunit|nr:thiamine pyrophosphate-binding protein [Gammaproteobacteria bacterium]
MIRVADYIFDFLAGLGTRHVFLVPGGGAMHLVDALGQNKNIEYIPTHHEQAATIAAEAYSRIPDSLGCALVTTGPGVTNALTPVAGAWIDSVPMFIISGQVKRADLMGNTGVRQMGPQEVNVQALASGITKYCVTLSEATDVRYHMERAYFEAVNGRPGPVWIDVPLDIQAAEINPDELRGFDEPEIHTGIPDEQLEQVLSAIKSAKKPLLFAGHGVRLSGIESAFRELVELLEVPIVTTWNAMDLLEWEHPLYVGKPGSVAMRAPNFAVQNCDLLIALGTRLDNVVTAFNPKGFGRQAKKILVDVDQAEIDKNKDALDISICANLNQFIPELLKKAKAESNPGASTPGEPTKDWVEQCGQWKKKFQVDDFGGNEKISHYEFVYALSNAVPEDTLVSTGSSGLGIEVFYTAYQNKKGQRVFLTSGLGAMGYGLPAAIGACLSNGSKPSVAVESDGSLQLNLQEFSTLKSLQLPIRLFILSNAGYGSIRATQRNYFDGRYVGTGPEAKLFLPDFEKIANTWEMPFVRIENSDQMASQIEQVLAMPGPVICEVVLQENEALRPKVSAIVQEDGSMISMPLEDMTPLLPLEEMREVMGGNLMPASIAARKNER